MPEGPEIRLAADRVARVLEGEQLEEVFLAPPGLRRFRPLLAGATVSRIETRGKAMLTHFDNELTLYSHNQLYGRWYVRRRGEFPRTGRSLRVGLHTTSNSALLYSATDIEVLKPHQLEMHPFLRRLGPDVLSDELTWPMLAARLAEPRFQGRSLASLYLDQGFVAGIGNYLRSEILHFARISHCRRARDLGRPERQRLARQTLAVARRSYRTRGVTNLPSRLRGRRAEGFTSDDRRFAVFARAGKRCDVCGSAIERVDAGSRRLYFCPTCQM